MKDEELKKKSIKKACMACGWKAPTMYKRKCSKCGEDLKKAYYHKDAAGTVYMKAVKE